ncbi:subtilisinlike serine protease [Fusarium sporotrichioides]|uniref:Subtilisinlike serine protease n=1 Tax=Fusarium sporotrichioides TaxID=5514 RepID=A0A395SDU4_FUSSP|nr:subtilisinlike serine protease [Fusarium sporotrichioides]
MVAPFTKENQLCNELCIKDWQIFFDTEEEDDNKQHLPGDPRMQLTDANIGERLRAEFLTEDLDKMAPHLWLMSTQSSSNISPLTEQITRGRRLIVTENPGLHLVWIHDRVFLKPLPEYLLSYAFWEYYLVSSLSPLGESVRQSLLKAISGFVRSYSYLIQHKSDFLLATGDELQLIPKSITFTQLVAFMSHCDIKDSSASPRYQFGELRLTRLNFWCKIFLSKSSYQRVEWQYDAHFAQYYGPLLFIFALISLLTNSMQVVLAAQDMLKPDDSWLFFAKVSRGFSIFTILFVACTAAGLLVALVYMILHEFVFAVKHFIFLNQ